MAQIEEQGATNFFPKGWAQWTYWAQTLFTKAFFLSFFLSFFNQLCLKAQTQPWPHHIHRQFLAVSEKEKQSNVLKNRSNVIHRYSLCFEDFYSRRIPKNQEENKTRTTRNGSEWKYNPNPFCVCLLPQPLSVSLIIKIFSCFPYPNTPDCRTLSRINWNCHTETANNANPFQMELSLWASHASHFHITTGQCLSNPLILFLHSFCRFLNHFVVNTCLYNFWFAILIVNLDNNLFILWI